MRFLTLLALLVFSYSWSQSTYANNVLYVQSVKAKILEHPNFAATPVIEISKGKIVEVIEKNPNWVNVRVDDHEGWVAAMLLAPTPPMSRDLLLEKLQQQDDSATNGGSQNVRKRRSMPATAAATRGLQDRSQWVENEQANYLDLKRMESKRVTNQDAWNFNKEMSQDR